VTTHDGLPDWHVCAVGGGSYSTLPDRLGRVDRCATGEHEEAIGADSSAQADVARNHHEARIDEPRRSIGRQAMAKDHGPSVKDDKQYEGLREKGMSKSRAASIANSPEASKKGGENSHSGGSSQSSKSSGSGSGGNRAQKQAAGRKGGKATASKS
jgi:hypothetical protein